MLFEATILKQVADLREMDEAGLLSSELRYFGMDSPRGNRWYNFDPSSYIECAITGTYDDFQEENSEITFDDISWNEISEFLWCGQIYE